MAKPKPAQKPSPAPAAPEPAGAQPPSPAKKGAPTTLLTQVLARLARGDNAGARALIDLGPAAGAEEQQELGLIRERLRFDPGVLAAAGAVLAAIFFSVVATILLRK